MTTTQPFTTKDLAATNVLVVDYNNLAMRAFYGSRTLTTSSGRPCNAILAMLRMTRVILETYRTFGVIMACDQGFPSFRSQLTQKWGPGYKTSRKKNPQPGIEDARKQREWAKSLFQWLGVVFVSAPDYEADDVIAWCTHRLAAQTPPYRSLIWSNDKDLRQLIGKQAAVIQSGEGDSHLIEERDPYLLLRRAVVGDKSDDVIGIRGIADKKFDAFVQDLPPVEGRPSHKEFLAMAEAATPSSKTSETVRAAILENAERLRDNMYVSDLRVTYRSVGRTLTVLNPNPVFSPDKFRQAALKEWGFASIAGAQDAFSEFMRPYSAMWQRGRVGSVLSAISRGVR